MIAVLRMVLLCAGMMLFDDGPLEYPIDCPRDNTCTGPCAGLHISGGAGVGGTPGHIHICDQDNQSCSYGQAGHPAGDDSRQSLTHNGCKVTIAPEQGLTWDEIRDCDDLRVYCQN
jgi:hypothetical protein